MTKNAEQDGSKYGIPYGKKNECIYSVGRRYVNEILLNKGKALFQLIIFFWEGGIIFF